MRDKRYHLNDSELLTKGFWLFEFNWINNVRNINRIYAKKEKEKVCTAKEKHNW